MTITNPDWTDRAACLPHNPDMWFNVNPRQETRPSRDTLRALAICRGCPVRVECLNRALDDEADHPREGIWGGLTPLERDELAEKRALPRQAKPRNLLAVKSRRQP